MMMCLKAGGMDCTEDEVNRVMGARPMKGAAWEQALACAQHYGFRATLLSPATINDLKSYTDRGVPLMIAWNPEGREWSHASVVFHVDDEMNVHVADPNIPNPNKTVRVVPEDEFYGKWFEKWPNYLVRRPAMAIEREITEDGRQVFASTIDYRLLSSIARTGPRPAKSYSHTEVAKIEQLRSQGLVDKSLSPAGHGIVYEVTPEGRNALGRRASSDWYIQLGLDLDHPMTGLVSHLQQLCEYEGNEATSPKDGVEMVAWDAGYNGQRLAPWLKKLGKFLKVNTDKHYRDGINTAKSNKQAKLSPPRHLKRTAPSGHYQIWFTRAGDAASPYITDVPSIQVAMRRAKETMALSGVDQVVIYDSLGNQFMPMKTASVQNVAASFERAASVGRVVAGWREHPATGKWDQLSKEPHDQYRFITVHGTYHYTAPEIDTPPYSGILVFQGSDGGRVETLSRSIGDGFHKSDAFARARKLASEHYGKLLRGRQTLASSFKEFFSEDVGNWYGKPSRLVVVDAPGGIGIALTHDSAQGRGFITTLGDKGGYPSVSAAIADAKKFAKKLQRGDGRALQASEKTAEIGTYEEAKEVANRFRAILKGMKAPRFSSELRNNKGFWNLHITFVGGGYYMGGRKILTMKDLDRYTNTFEIPHNIRGAVAAAFRGIAGSNNAKTLGEAAWPLKSVKLDIPLESGREEHLSIQGFPMGYRPADKMSSWLKPKVVRKILALRKQFPGERSTLEGLVQAIEEQHWNNVENIIQGLSPQVQQIIPSLLPTAALSSLHLASFGVEAKKKNKKPKLPKQRDPNAQAMAEGQVSGGGHHHNRERDVARGHSRKPKHKKNWDE